MRCFSDNYNDNIDVETVDKDVKLFTYRPDIKAKSMESYRNSKTPRDPETWEDNINKYVYNYFMVICCLFLMQTITIYLVPSVLYI